MMHPKLRLAAAVAFSVHALAAGGSASALANDAADALSDLPAVEVLRLQVPAEPRAFRSSLTIGGTPMTLDLTPYSVRSRGFRVLVQVQGGELITRDPGPVTTLRGSILELPGSRAVGRLVDGELEAMVFLPGQRVLQIEPASRHLPQVEPGVYAAYPCGGPGALIGDEELGCGVVSEPGNTGSPAIPLGPGGGVEDCAALGTCVAELLCDTDWSVYVNLGSDPMAVQSFVEYMVAVANERFNDWTPDLDIRHLISDVVIRTDQASDPYQGATSNSDLMGRLGQEWPSSTHTSDLIHLFSNLQAGGLGQTARVCQNGLSVSNGTTATCQRGVLLAHELGHNWGAPHVLTGIMRAFGGSCSSTWDGCTSSSCSPICCAPTKITDRRDGVDATCLDLLVEADLGVEVTTKLGTSAVSIYVTNAGPDTEPEVTLDVTFSSAEAYTLTPGAGASSCQQVPVNPPPGGWAVRYECALGGLESGLGLTPTWNYSGSVFVPDILIEAEVWGEGEDPVAANNEDTFVLCTACD